uniref:Mitotic spindle organizing protein 2B n=1 Tax=Equus asinus TaxID=9793 RepID=A0A9L0JP13_EQUAS
MAAALQKLALRRKKVLSAEEMELYELAQAAGGAMDPDVFKILLDLLKLNLAPLAVFQMLKSTCAGQRLPSESQAAAAVSLLTSSAPETRGQSWARCSLPLWPGRRGPPFPGSSPPAASAVLLHGPAAPHSPLSPGPPGSLRFSCCPFSPFTGCRQVRGGVGGLESGLRNGWLSFQGEGETWEQSPPPSRGCWGSLTQDSGCQGGCQC